MHPDTDFHAHFMRAVDRWRDGAAPAPGGPASLAAPAFAVYANTGLRACIDALEASYPSVRHWLGAPRFEHLAAGFARAHPPTDARMFLYGQGFADHLQALAPPDFWPDLTDLARVDRCRTEAHAAGDAEPLAAADLAQLPAAALGATVLAPMPATRWHGSAVSPVLDLWTMASRGDTATQHIARRAQAVLITRPDDDVLLHAMPLPGIALLQACACGQPLAQAAAAAQATDPGVDLQALLATLFAQGAFRALSPPSTPPPREIP